jgi:hypothetical protein
MIPLIAEGIVTGRREILTRRRVLASFGVLAGLTGMGCASSNAITPGGHGVRP